MTFFFLTFLPYLVGIGLLGLMLRVSPYLVVIGLGIITASWLFG